MKKYLVYFALTFFLIILILQYQDSDALVFSTFVAIALFGCLELFNRRYVKYGLYIPFYTFAIVFLSIAPLLQFLEGEVLWGGADFSNENYIYLNIIIFTSLLIYKFSYAHSFNRYKQYYKHVETNPTIEGGGFL